MAAWVNTRDHVPSGRIVSVDVETTDHPHLPTTRVIEIGAVEVLDGVLTSKRFSSYVACDEPSVPGAFEKHQLTVDKLMADGRPIAEVLADFLAFIGDAPILCHGRFHGVNCDEVVLNGELQRHALPPLTNAIIQTTDIFGFVTLGKLCGFFGVPNDGAHGAVRDAEMLAECYLKHKQYGFPYGLPVYGAVTSQHYLQNQTIQNRTTPSQGQWTTGDSAHKPPWPLGELEAPSKPTAPSSVAHARSPPIKAVELTPANIRSRTGQQTVSRSKVDMENLTPLQKQVMAQLQAREESKA